MKKLILAIVALAFAFAISSCCDQAQCPKNKRCNMKEEEGERAGWSQGRNQERPYRFDKPSEEQQEQQQERQSRRW